MVVQRILNAGFLSLALGVGASSFAQGIRRSHLDLDLKQNRYLGGIQHSAQNSNYTILGADLTLQSANQTFDYKINTMAEGALEVSNELYFGVPELYARPVSAPEITIGRQRRNWSYLDQEFALGVWQPQLRWDYLQPVQQGLTGLFVDLEFNQGDTKLTLFTSPFHIPDQGPQFQITRGRFESSNRWFVQPQSQLSLFRGTTFSSDVPLYFELDKPSEQDLIMHPSFGLAIRHQNAKSPLWTQASYAYKPRNQIHLGIECTNCVNIGTPTPVEITALVHTKIVKHHVLTWETGFDRTDDGGWISITGDVPERSDFPDSYEEAPLNKMIVAGAGYRHFVGRWLGRPSWLRYSYMRLWELEEDLAPGLVPGDQVESSLDRYPYEEVVAVDWSLLLRQARRDRWSFRTRYSYSIPERGSWLMSSVEYATGPATFALGVDVLGSEVDPNSASAGLFSRYRANDRFFGGLTYVF